MFTITVNQTIVDNLAIKINSKEKQSNKVTSLSSSSTHAQYPSAKAVYDAIQLVDGGDSGLDVENFYIDTTNDEIVIVSGSSGSGGSGGSGGGSDVIVDSSWISDSTNPIQSKLIKSALDGKASSTHTHTKSQITDFPTIPSKTSELTNDSGFLTSHQSLTNYVQKSQTAGLIKNDGSIDTSTYLTTHQSLTNYVQKSQTAGLIKNDGSIDTSTYLTSHQSLSGYLQTSDVIDNLSSTSTTAPLSAKQGKMLDEKIGNILTIINGTGGGS